MTFLYSSTLSIAQLQLGGSKHLTMPVNLGLSIDFFKFTSMFILGKVKHCIRPGLFCYIALSFAEEIRFIE